MKLLAVTFPSTTNVDPRFFAAALMTGGLCLHFFGYECARAASIAMIADKGNGLGHEALPLTIALGSPAGGCVLYLYTKSIKSIGSMKTLRVSFSACVFIMAVITCYCRSFSGIAGKAAIIFFYAFREIYVSLLSTQQWAFIASTLTTANARYLVTCTGIVSVASAIGGCAVEQIVHFGGVPLLLLTALAATGASFAVSELANWTMRPVLELAELQTERNTSPGDYDKQKNRGEVGPSLGRSHGNEKKEVAVSALKVGKDYKYNRSVVDSKSRHRARHQQLPAAERAAKAAEAVRRSTDASSSFSTKTMQHPENPIQQKRAKSCYSTEGAEREEGKPAASRRKGGFWSDSWHLIREHRLLQLLFAEAITHQLCKTMLNLMFHNGLRQEVSDDSLRAKLVGRFFATVNIASCSLQCLVLPSLLSQATLPAVLTNIPFIVFAVLLLGVVRPGLISVMLGFGTIKVLEYSIMTAATEMVYLPMGRDVRYLGKELVRFFGHKLGHSGTSLALSALISHFNPTLAQQSLWGACFTIVWGAVMLMLARYLQARDAQVDETLQTKTVVVSVEEINGTQGLEKETEVEGRVYHREQGDWSDESINESGKVLSEGRTGTRRRLVGEKISERVDTEYISSSGSSSSSSSSSSAINIGHGVDDTSDQHREQAVNNNNNDRGDGTVWDYENRVVSGGCRGSCFGGAGGERGERGGLGTLPPGRTLSSALSEDSFDLYSISEEPLLLRSDSDKSKRRDGERDWSGDWSEDESERDEEREQEVCGARLRSGSDGSDKDDCSSASTTVSPPLSASPTGTDSPPFSRESSFEFLSTAAASAAATATTATTATPSPTSSSPPSITKPFSSLRTNGKNNKRRNNNNSNNKARGSVAMKIGGHGSGFVDTGLLHRRNDRFGGRGSGARGTGQASSLSHPPLPLPPQTQTLLRVGSSQVSLNTLMRRHQRYEQKPNII